jgi:hypothetical protein
LLPKSGQWREIVREKTCGKQLHLIPAEVVVGEPFEPLAQLERVRRLHDFTWQFVHILSSGTKNMDAVIAVEHGPIRPCL